MKERPILFSAPMVRAILAGTKTQTRRVLAPRGWGVERMKSWRLAEVVSGDETRKLTCAQPAEHAYAGFLLQPDSASPCYFKCPYGQPGDRLWVRETFRGPLDDGSYGYRATHTGPFTWESYTWKPSIHMPRAASRIALEIADVRVERLQDISEADALAEGIVQLHDGGYGLPAGEHYHSADPRKSYLSLWEAINGPGSVEANPWVWVVEFPRFQAPGAAL